MKSYGGTIQLKQLKPYLFTFTINKLQIQTTCKIVELIEAGGMETCLLPMPGGGGDVPLGPWNP